ncbi:glycosyltransferase family 4 protein [Streptococcus alactolyticus]|uniref:glycosyltransferase family 4 protein n=1 Tax=Streptococcus alactolyticus TaxID=29389 RepID=UPI003F958687
MIGNHESVHGGITSVIKQILDHEWTEGEVDIRFLPSYKGGNVVNKIFYFAVTVFRLVGICCFEKPDVVHIHMSHHGSFDRANILSNICKSANIPVIVHLHGSEFEKYYEECNLSKRKKIESFFNDCNAVIVLGDKWKKFIQKISPKAVIYVFNNSIQIPEKFELKDRDEVRFLFLGVLFERKGVMDLLKSIDSLNQEGILKSKSPKFIIAGTGPEEERLKKYELENNISNYVEFVGWIDGKEKKNYLETCDILILPSYNEGLPIAILEALSYGMPVVSTDVGSISEAVHDHLNGFLFNPGDVTLLSAHLKKLIMNKDLRCKMSIESRKLAEMYFDDKKYFIRLEALYKKFA